MGRSGHGADDDVVEREPEFALLRAYLLGEADITEPAEFVHRCAGRNRIGTPALGLDLLERVLPAFADADVEAVLDQPHVRAHDPAQHDVADPVVDRVLVRNPGLLHQPAFHADFRRDRGDLAGMVRLDPADRNQRVGVRGNRVGDDIFELAQLVAAEGEARIAVFALGVKLDPVAEMGAETLQPLDRRRAEGERIAFEFFEHGRAFPVRIARATLNDERMELNPPSRPARPSRPLRVQADVRSPACPAAFRLG